ncbi:MAG: hypothetical protein NTV43_16995 [Methylococcales bacterium]|nr:hypothetical protein [Methylococcales bacterium]
MIDTNTLYLVIGGFIAIVIGIGLFKSDTFKAIINKKGMNVEAGKQAKKAQTRIKKVTNKSDIAVAQKDGHEVEIEDIDNSKINVTK